MSHRAVALVAAIALVAPATVAMLAQPAAAALQGDIYTIAGSGAPDLVPGASNGDGTAAASALMSPDDTAFDAQGNIAFMDDDGDRVRIVAVSTSNPGYALSGCPSTCVWTAGDVYTIVGSGVLGYNGDGIPATIAQLGTQNLGANVAFDPQGDLLITDRGNYRERVVAEAASNPGYALFGCAGPCTWTVGDIFTIAGSGTAGDAGDGGPASAAAFNGSMSEAVDSVDNVLISDEENERIRIVAVSASNPGYPLSGCASTCVWTPGDIYTVAGTGTVGYNRDGIPAVSTEFDLPAGLTVDPNGNPLVSDAGNSRVRVVAVSASDPGYALAGCAGACAWTVGDIYTIAGSGTPGVSGDGGPAASAGLPTLAVASDHEGNVLNGDGSRIRVVARSGSNPGYLLSGCSAACTWIPGDIYTIAGTGEFDVSGDGGPATAAGTPEAAHVSIDAGGNVYIPGASRIREVVVVPTTPGAPVSPSAVTTNSGAIVSWSAPAWSGGMPVTGYQVTPYVGATADSARVFASTATTQAITGLTNGKPYTFRVAAINALGTGPESITAVIITGTPAPPNSVRAASRATSKKTGALTVRYAAGASNGSPFVKFNATCTPRVRSAGVIPRSAVHIGPSAAPIVVGGLVTKKGYSCAVIASTSRGKSLASAASTLVVVGAPGAPTGPHPVRVEAGVVKVNFASGPNNGAKTTTYTARCTSVDGGATVRGVAKRSPVTVTGFTEGRTYTCTVWGTNSRGAGPPSGPSPHILV